MDNVALVVLDTLRKDAFDDHFDWLPGRRFENAWSPSHWTVPAHAAMFTGRYPSELGVHANAERLDCPDPVLAELLSEAGYRTRAFSTNGNVSSHFLYDRGFDEFAVSWRAEGWQEELELKKAGEVFDWKRFDADSGYPPVLRDVVGLLRSVLGEYDTLPSIRHWLGRKLRGPGSPGFDDSYRDFGATEALEWVESREFGDEAEFCFLNLMEAHNPYDPPEAYQTVEPVRINGLLASVRGPEVDPERVRTAYDDSVRYLADMYERIFEVLRANFDYVVTVSDHGELLGEHGRWEHLCGLYPELTHVPLVVSGVDGGPVDTMGSLLDVHRTVASLAGVEPGPAARGRNLLADGVPDGTLTEYHGLSGLHLRSLSEDEVASVAELNTELHGIATPPSYYGYETVEDGFHSRGTADDPDPAGTMAALAASLDRREVDHDDHENISEDVLDHLERLGYA
jgi:arylsulfatase A-like enzyme